MKAVIETIPLKRFCWAHGSYGFCGSERSLEGVLTKIVFLARLLAFGYLPAGSNLHHAFPHSSSLMNPLDCGRITRHRHFPLIDCT